MKRVDFNTSKKSDGFVGCTLFYKHAANFPSKKQFAVSGSGADTWIVWSDELVKWIDRQLKKSK